MHKKLLAWAVATAFAAPLAAYAQGSNVVIYGTINADFENVESDSATNGGAGNGLVSAPAANGNDLGARNRVSSNSSNIGFRGTEDLGIAGLKAIFQCESGVNIDSGAGSTSSGTFCTRNSNVGLTGPWGTAFYGNWDTPYKFHTLRQDAWYATGIASGISILATPGFGVGTTTQSGRVGVVGVPATAGVGGPVIPGVFSTAAVSGAPDASFDRRQGNSVQYWTPVWAGLSGRLAYSANEQKSANEANPNINPYIGSAAILYENGPIYATFAYERHEDYFGLFGLTGAAAQAPSPTNQSSKDQGFKAGVGYTFFGTTTLNVNAERLEYENSQTAAGATTEYNREAFYVSVLHKIGPGTIRGSFGKGFSGDCEANGATCSTAGLAGKAATIGYSHSLSKRTDLYALYVYIDNDRLASYNFGVNALTGAGVGSDPSGLALGVRHAF
ncbi:MAG: porin [Burkholderiales bacterium]|nr:porin [Burkholderiales bacterium]